MDIDPPQNARALSRKKRARSPASAASRFDRPAKRPSIGGDASICMPISRYAYEDWVAQTRGLRIATPHTSQGHTPPIPEETEDIEVAGPVPAEATAVDTTMLDNDVDMSCSPPRFRHGIDVQSEPPAPLTLPSFSASAPQPQLPLPLLPGADTSHTGFRADEREAHRTHIYDILSPLIPTAEHAVGHGQSTTRRQRFTMGPRADCEKCRLGVRGHWMHVD